MNGSDRIRKRFVIQLGQFGHWLVIRVKKFLEKIEREARENCSQREERRLVLHILRLYWTGVAPMIYPCVEVFLCKSVYFFFSVHYALFRFAVWFLWPYVVLKIHKGVVDWTCSSIPNSTRVLQLTICIQKYSKYIASVLFF